MWQIFFFEKRLKILFGSCKGLFLAMVNLGEKNIKWGKCECMGLLDN
jgi:hypothetical protein